MFIQSNVSGEWEEYSEEELWAAYRADNKDAFSALFLRCYKRLFRYGMQYSASEEAVRDGIQKLFLRLWEKRERLACPRSVQGYLYVSLRRILRRESTREKARDKRHVDFMEANRQNVHSVEEMIICQEERQKRRELLQFALKELTPRQKEALLLRIDSGMSNPEIADIMNVSDKRVRNLIYEGTKKLKQEVGRLADYSGESKATQS